MRKHRKRIAVLFVVVGILCLIIAAFFGVAALFQFEHEQGKFLRPAAYYLAGGLLMIAFYYLAFVLPEYMRDRRSETSRRRREHFKNFQRPPGSSGHGGRRKDGGVLLLTLLLLGAVSAVALHVITTARAAHAGAERALRMELLALSALDEVRDAMQRIADDADLNIDHAGEPWAEFLEITDPAGITRMTRVSDAHRAFDLNNLAVVTTGAQRSPTEMLANILVMCGHFTPGRQVEALRDWIDTDTAGAYETPHYQRMSPPYQTASRVLYGLEELLHVDGWSAQSFVRKPFPSRTSLFEAELADSVTILPVARNRVIPLNINTVEPMVLRGILGLGAEAAADYILSRRRSAPFRDTLFLSDLVGQETYQRISPYLAVKSSYFHIQASAFSGDRSAKVNVLAYRHDDGRVDVVRAVF